MIWVCNFLGRFYHLFWKGGQRWLFSSPGGQLLDLVMPGIGLNTFRQFRRHKVLKNFRGHYRGSGPFALLGLRDFKSFKMLMKVTLIGLSVGSLSFSLKSEVILGEGLEKTELKTSWIKFAFFNWSLVKMLFLSFKSEMPILSCFLLFKNSYTMTTGIIKLDRLLFQCRFSTLLAPYSGVLVYWFFGGSRRFI